MKQKLFILFNNSHDDDNLITDKTSIHLEAFYRIQVNDRVEITPETFAVFNPDTEDNNTLWIRTVRTEFSF